MLAYSFEHMHESENLMIGGSDSVSRTTNQCRQLDLNNESENGQLSAHRHIAYFHKRVLTVSLRHWTRLQTTAENSPVFSQFLPRNAL